VRMPEVVPDMTEVAERVYASPEGDPPALPAVRRYREAKRAEAEDLMSDSDRWAVWAFFRAQGYRDSIPVEDALQSVLLGMVEGGATGDIDRSVKNALIDTTRAFAGDPVPPRTLYRYKQAVSESLKRGRDLTEEELRRIGIRRATVQMLHRQFE